MRTAVERILETWDYVFERQGSHPPLLVSLQGLTAAQAAWKPSPDRNSVWEILNHIALWKEYFASRLAGELPRPSGWARGVDWQAIGEVTEPAWQSTIQRLIDAHAALKAELAKRSDEDLERPLPGSKYPLYAIQNMIAHDAYHCGQISYIRALQRVPTHTA